jgi:hypothetical protein
LIFAAASNRSSRRLLHPAGVVAHERLRLTMLRALHSTIPRYCSIEIEPSHGAGHLPISLYAHAFARGASTSTL